MKVLMFAMEYFPIWGGGGSYVKNLVYELARQKIKVYLVTNGKTESIKKLNTNLIIYRSPLFRDLYFGEGSFIKGVDKIVNVIREQNPDILHTHHSLESLIAQAANINFGLPHVITHHKTPEYRDKSFKLNGKWSVFSLINRQQKISFIAPSQSFVRSLLDSGVNSNKITQIYPGVDRKTFRKIKDKKKTKEMRRELGLNENDLLILIPTKIRVRKGLVFALKALSKTQVEGKNLKVLITGIMEKGVEKETREEFKKILSPNTLLIQKPFKSSKMPLLYNTADLVILTSKAEGLGMALIEAMACGAPVVGADVMGINEVIENGVNGELISWGNEKELIESILKIILNPKVRKKYIAGGSKTLAKKFNLEEQTKKHIEIYKRLIQERNGGKSRQSEKRHDSTTLKKLICNLSSYGGLKNNEQLMAILLIGSIPEGKFIPGWSDIDLLALAKSPNANFFKAVSALQAQLQEASGVKTGIEIIDSDQISKATNNHILANDYIKFIKNFYKDSKPELVIYLKKGFALPRFNKKTTRKLSVSSHATSTLSYMYKYFVSNKHQFDKKDLLRKIVKNSLLLMQVYLLIKFDDFESDYGQAIQKYRAIQNKSLTALQKTFGKRFQWGKLKDSDINDKEIEKNWQIFLEIANTNRCS